MFIGRFTLTRLLCKLQEFLNNSVVHISLEHVVLVINDSTSSQQLDFLFNHLHAFIFAQVQVSIPLVLFVLK